MLAARSAIPVPHLAKVHEQALLPLLITPVSKGSVKNMRLGMFSGNVCAN